MRNVCVYSILTCFIIGLFVITPAALAGPFNPNRYLVDPPISGPYIPLPENVPGKEYSDHMDKEGHPNNGALDPEQNITWDGLFPGGTANGFDYGGQEEVDALANSHDVLFHSVIRNSSALLFSTDDDPNIYVEPIWGMIPLWNPPNNVWADGTTQPGNDINQGAGLPNDVDGLEVWGEDGPGGEDANRYSLEGDPLWVSVWEYDSVNQTSDVLFTQADIAGAVIGFANGKISLTDLEDIIDLDAMMIFGYEIMFSIDLIANPNDPLNPIFDGGEIWTWDGVTVGGAAFLNHGGHLWDTAFDVMGTFGTASENINALEAVSTPEPATMLLFGLGVIGLAGLGRRKFKKS